MKATIDIPDDLYRRVKAKSALAGRAVREVTIELYQQWLAAEQGAPAQSAQGWLQSWLGRADELMKDVPAEPGAPPYGAPEVAEARTQLLRANLALPPAERLRRAEELLRLAPRRPVRRHQVLGFDSYDDYYEWKKTRNVR